MTTAITTAPAATEGVGDLAGYCSRLVGSARDAASVLAATPGHTRDAALLKIADRLNAAKADLQAANAKDLDAGRANGMQPAMLDRLTLTDARIAAMADGVRRVAAQTDPLGRVIEGRVLPNGIRLQKVCVPIGVVLIIFESRPNVTSDAAALCLKSGNAVILRGGKEALHSNAAIARCVRAGLADAGLPDGCVEVVETPDRAAVGELLKMEGRIDLCIPRGGESLIRAVVEQSRVPVIKHYTGNCHVYVDAAADVKMARDICINAKTQRPGVCNAAETLLFHRDAAEHGVLRYVCEALAKQGVEIRGDDETRRLFPAAAAAAEADWAAEYLDLILAVKVVATIDEAIAHINRYGSRHTDAIVTADLAAADRFVQQVDSAGVFVNCSTRFADGGEYGLGAEIGISTDKLHARGPMGADDLTTYKWVAYGSGQVRA
jgi:glutamate-5-semialdehyde dehydrogenase